MAAEAIPVQVACRCSKGRRPRPDPQESDAAAWTVAFRVADADASVARAQQLGGTVLLPPMDVPVGRFAIVADPIGAAFTVTAVPGGPIRGVDGS